MMQKISNSDAPFSVEFIADCIELQIPKSPTGWRLNYRSFPAVSLAQLGFDSEILSSLHSVSVQSCYITPIVATPCNPCTKSMVACLFDVSN